MEVGNIKKQIEMALDSVEGLDELYKLETYKIILAKSLESSISSEKVTNIQNNDKDVPKNYDSGIKELADLCHVDKREVFDILDIENGEIILKKVLQGPIRKRHVEGTQLILLGYEFGLGIKEVDSKTLKAILKDAHIEDDGNFSTNIKSKRDLFTLSPKKTNRYTYSLNAKKGRDSAIELLRMYAKGETKED